MALLIINSRYICKKAHRFSKYLYSTMSDLLNKIPDVDIDEHGRFKYILINVQDKLNKTEKTIVRGYAKCPYHADIFDETNEKLSKLGNLSLDCPGGGRIEHDPDAKTLKVYGYSQGYGKADHKVAVSMLKKVYPDYNITWSDDGY